MIILKYTCPMHAELAMDWIQEGRIMPPSPKHESFEAITNALTGTIAA